MRISILLRDSVTESIETNFPGYPEMISSMFADTDCSLEFAAYDIVNLQPSESISECVVPILLQVVAAV